MQKWEYCIIDGIETQTLISPAVGGWFYKGLMTGKGIELADYNCKLTGLTKGDTVSQCIAQLGDDGWEMVGAGNMSESRHCLYFKRPKP